MAIELNSFVWASTGIEPTNKEDAVYNAGDQPIAGYDNWFNWAISDDLHELTSWVGSHGDVHQSGGSQEINLQGLQVGNVVAFRGIDADDEFKLTDLTNDTDYLRIDVADDRVRQFPEFGTHTVHREGITVRSDIENAGGDVVYDHSSNKFHHAAEADNADHADIADDADTVDGYEAADFLREDISATVTEPWTFTTPVDTDISGHASTASNAAHADEADEADMAADSLLFDGRQRSAFAELALDETISGNWTFDNVVDTDITGSASWADDAGDSELLEGKSLAEIAELLEAETVEETWTFTKNIVVEGDVIGDDGNPIIDSVPHAEEADWAAEADWADNAGHADTADHANSADWADQAGDANRADKLDGYDASDLIDMMNADAGKVDEAAWADNAGHADTADYADTAEYAEEAEYAQNSNRLDGYHASDILGLINNESRWHFIDDWDVGGGSSSYWELDMNLSSTDVFDRYRLVILTNNVDGRSDNYSHYRLYLNDDRRQRYYVRQISGDGDIDHFEYPYFRVGWSARYGTSVQEYEISCPEPLINDGNRRNYPTISTIAQGQHQEVAYPPIYGHLETDYDEVDQLTLYHGSDNPNRVYVKLYGNDIVR